METDVLKESTTLDEEAPTTIERQAARLSPDIFLYAAAGSIIASLTLKSLKRDHDALFVGQWAPTFLLLAIHSRLVKLFESESQRY